MFLCYMLLDYNQKRKLLGLQMVLGLRFGAGAAIPGAGAGVPEAPAQQRFGPAWLTQFVNLRNSSQSPHFFHFLLHQTQHFFLHKTQIECMLALNNNHTKACVGA